MKHILFFIIGFVVLGMGCDTYTIKNIQNMKDLTQQHMTQLEMTTDPQDAVFYLEVGWTGGMGSARVVDDNGPVFFDNYPVFLQEDKVEEILSMGGGLPDCVVGKPLIKVSARIMLTKTSDIRYSTPVPETVTYYEARINNINDVVIKAEECR